MGRKFRVLGSIGVVALATLLPALAAGQDKGLERPNIIVFLSDDHGQAFAGCYGNPVIRTPHMDGLAREGMRLTRVFAASPTCSPSRSSLYTGLYPARHGAMGNHTDCRPTVGSLPHYLEGPGLSRRAGEQGRRPAPERLRLRADPGHPAQRPRDPAALSHRGPGYPRRGPIPGRSCAGACAASRSA